jgi:excisionase family DNA binding protein
MTTQINQTEFRVWLLRAGLRVQDLADRLGVSRNAVQKWLKSGRVPAARVEGIDVALGCTAWRVERRVGL